MERELDVPRSAIALREPGASDRLGGALVHVGAIFAPILFPIGAMLFTRKKKDYVYAHARQSLVETIWLNVFLGIAIVTSLSFTAAHILELYQGGVQNIDWWKELLNAGIKFAISYILMALLGFFNTIVSVLQAIKAYQGEWPKSWRKKMAKAGRAL
ncbi:MAG: DUF4870 domain-containing protein [Armatimonadetes bacterium]|nr:DUF4870 domain-containing protein [Armatimonadota bacterium]